MPRTRLCQPIRGYRQVKHPGDDIWAAHREAQRTLVVAAITGLGAVMLIPFPKTGTVLNNAQRAIRGPLAPVFPGVAAVTGGHPTTQVIPHVSTN